MGNSESLRKYLELDWVYFDVRTDVPVRKLRASVKRLTGGKYPVECDDIRGVLQVILKPVETTLVSGIQQVTLKRDGAGSDAFVAQFIEVVKLLGSAARDGTCWLPIVGPERYGDEIPNHRPICVHEIPKTVCLESAHAMTYALTDPDTCSKDCDGTGPHDARQLEKARALFRRLDAALPQRVLAGLQGARAMLRRAPLLSLRKWVDAELHRLGLDPHGDDDGERIGAEIADGMFSRVDVDCQEFDFARRAVVRGLSDELSLRQVIDQRDTAPIDRWNVAAWMMHEVLSTIEGDVEQMGGVADCTALAELVEMGIDAASTQSWPELVTLSRSVASMLDDVDFHSELVGADRDKTGILALDGDDYFRGVPELAAEARDALSKLMTGSRPKRRGDDSYAVVREAAILHAFLTSWLACANELHPVIAAFDIRMGPSSRGEQPPRLELFSEGPLPLGPEPCAEEVLAHWRAQCADFLAELARG